VAAEAHAKEQSLAAAYAAVEAATVYCPQQQACLYRPRGSGATLDLGSMRRVFDRWCVVCCAGHDGRPGSPRPTPPHGQVQHVCPTTSTFSQCTSPESMPVYQPREKALRWLALVHITDI
jgi:hypothetical protein